MSGKYLALDIGNVCVKLHPERCFGALGFRSIGEVPVTLLEAIQHLETGRMSEEDFIGWAKKTLGLDWSEEAFLELWNANLGEGMPGMTALVRDLKKAGIEPVFFSDTSIIHMRYFRQEYPICEFVTKGIYSFVVGACKPDPAMYAAFEADYGKPVLYVDDRPCNIEGAETFGWKSHLFESAEKLRAELGL